MINNSDDEDVIYGSDEDRRPLNKTNDYDSD